MSTPAAACSATTWRTAASLWRLSSALSTASPASSRINRSVSTALRGRLPTWVVRMRSSLRFMSVHLCPDRLHDVGPPGTVALHGRLELLDSLPARRVAKLGELLPSLGIVQRHFDGGIELAGDGHVQALRSEDREPRVALVARHTRLIDGRHVGDCRDALLGGDAQQPHLAGAPVLQDGLHLVEDAAD